jgi:hypothetical protein
MRKEISIPLTAGGLATIKEVRPLDYYHALTRLRLLEGDRSVGEVDSTEWDSCWLSLALIETTGEANNFYSLTAHFLSNQIP